MDKTLITNNLLKHREDAKSLIFLYPLLQLPANTIKPIGTYMDLADIDLQQVPYLFCMYHANQPGMSPQVRKQLLEHPMYEFSFSEEGYEVFAFNFDGLSSIYNCIKNGQYTQMESIAKLVILKEKHPIAQIALHPEAFYEDFAFELECSIEDVIEKVELIAPPSLESEVLTLNPVVKKQVLALVTI